MLRVLTFLVLIAASTAKLPFLFGECPRMDAQDDFDMTKYRGIWYEQRRYPDIYDIIKKCITYQIDLEPSGRIPIVRKYKRSIMNSAFTQIGEIRNPSGDSKMMVSFDDADFEPYWVLSTDYNSYAIVYTCSKYLWGYGEKLSILTRERIPSPEVLTYIDTFLQTRGLSASYLVHVEQQNCY